MRKNFFVDFAVQTMCERNFVVLSATSAFSFSISLSGLFRHTHTRSVHVLHPSLSVLPSSWPCGLSQLNSISHTAQHRCDGHSKVRWIKLYKSLVIKISTSRNIANWLPLGIWSSQSIDWSLNQTDSIYVAKNNEPAKLKFWGFPRSFSQKIWTSHLRSKRQGILIYNYNPDITATAAPEK